MKNLFEEGLLKKISPSKEKSSKSLEVAEKYVEEAKAAFRAKLYSSAILVSYNAMFHAARAVLFKDGIKERSHYAMIEYLLEKYKNELGQDILNRLDSYRLLRHSVAYGLDSKINEEDVETTVEFAEEFVEKVNEFLEK